MFVLPRQIPIKPPHRKNLKNLKSSTAANNTKIPGIRRAGTHTPKSHTINSPLLLPLLNRRLGPLFASSLNTFF